MNRVGRQRGALASGPTISPTAGAALPGPALAALQAVLAGEHAVVWAYGTLGPRAGEAEDVAFSQLVAHTTSRDRLRALVVQAGATPVAAEPAYALPVDPTDPGSAAQVAAIVEERLAAVYADLVAATSRGDLRSLAVDGVRTSAAGTARWRGSAPPLPGLPERAGTGSTGPPTGAPSE